MSASPRSTRPTKEPDDPTPQPRRPAENARGVFVRAASNPSESPNGCVHKIQHPFNMHLLHPTHPTHRTYSADSIQLSTSWDRLMSNFPCQTIMQSKRLFPALDNLAYCHASSCVRYANKSELHASGITDLTTTRIIDYLGVGSLTGIFPLFYAGKSTPFPGSRQTPTRSFLPDGATMPPYAFLPARPPPFVRLTTD